MYGNVKVFMNENKIKHFIILLIIGTFVIHPIKIKANVYEFTKVNGVYINKYGEEIPGVRKRGIDISAYQKDIDWEEVARDDVSFVFIRCANTNQGIDETFETNAKGALKNGIPIGIYYRSTALTKKQALLEAKYTIQEAKKYHVTYPLVIDVEGYPMSELSKENLREIIKVFCEEVKSAGYEPMIYASKDWFENRIGNLPYRRWVAQYNSECTYNGKRSFWQCSSKGKIRGIKGNVDIDFQY